jgi:hypothetical protein
MAKKQAVEVEEEVDDEKEVEEEVPQKKQKVLAKKVAKKLEEAEEEIEEATGKRQNIIQYEKTPRVDDPEFDFKSWAKSLDEKIDALVAHHKTPEKPTDDEPEEIEEPKPEPAWYDKELL